MEGLTGTAAKDMLGRGDYEYAIPFFGRKRPMLIDLANQPNREIEKTYLSLKRVGGTLFGESHHPDMGGGEVYLAGAARPLIDAGGRVVGAVESLRDITSIKKEGRALEADRDWLEQRVSERTAELVELNRRLAAEINERRQAEEARRAAETELEKQRAQSIRNDRLTSLGQLAAGIAHELNQPLLGVRGLAEHLVLGVERGWDLTSDRVREKLELIVGQADRMAHIVEHVRLFAREAGAAKTELVNLSQAAESAWGLLGAQFRSRGIGVARSLAGDLPLVEANLYSLEEVILNLMINARDAVEQKRAVTTAQAPARVELATLTLDGMVCIQVRDWGAGISPELLPRIFEPFFTTKGPEEGSGLGLAICRSIIERFKGRIDVQSQPGEGTTVTVRLPPARTEAAGG
jgi:C4-dicarboxylate-specific signal transduction histidine kinase